MSGGSASGDKLVKPGYHIRAKYDLHGLRRRRTSHGKGEIAGELPLTSMIDMLSILVIYLLMNFSATGEIFFMNKNVVLPKASKSNPMESGPLISIVDGRFVLEAPTEYESPSPIEDASPALSGISASLARFGALAKQKGLPTDNRVNIQAGEDAPIGLIKRAMGAAVTAGWTNINFITEKPKGAPAN